MRLLVGSLLLSAAVVLEAGAALGGELTAPDVQYPNVGRHARSPDGFVPAGWRLEVRATGDLNGDRLPDVALVVRQSDPANVLDATEQGGPKAFDTNPRILVVALAEPEGGFRLALANHTLIERTTNPNADDFLDAIDIKRGVLRVGLRLFMSSGGWNMGGSTFAFRLRSGKLRLIGFDSSDVVRYSGAFRDVRVNYLTRRMKITSGDASDNAPDMVVWRQMSNRPLLTVDQIGDGVIFDPAK